MLTNRQVMFFVFVATLLVPVAGAAQSWTPFPKLSGHFGVQPELDGPRWAAAESCLPGKTSNVGATYYAAVVSITDRNGIATPSANDAVPYVDALYEQAWRSDLEPETHVLIALGLDNRAVAIHPGTRWVGYGFEQDVITRTIDRSAFKDFARSGDYAEAICVLASSIDAKLTDLEAEIGQSRTRTRARLEVLDDDLRQASKLLAQAEERHPKLHADVKHQLVRARDKARSARAALEDRPAQARSYEHAATAAVRSAEQMLASYDQFAAQIPAWKKRITEIRSRAKNSPAADHEEVQQSLERLDECERRVDQGLDDLMSSRTDDSNSIEYCINAVDSNIEDAERSHFFITQVVPATVAILFVALLLVILIVLSVRRRRVGRLVEGQLGNWKDALGTASERLLALETEFSMYFDAGRPAWTGASQDLDQDCADEVNRVFLMFAKAQDIYEDAQAAFENAPPLRAAPLDAVMKKLETATVTIETGEAETRRRIFLPLTQSYSASASKLLSDLQGSYERAATLLTQATGLMEEVDRLRVETSAIGTDCVEAISKRADFGLPQEHLLALQVKGERQRSAGVDIAATDPKASIEHLSASLETLREARRLGSMGNAAVIAVREDLPVRLAGLRARIDKMREHGWVVKEPGFDPDQRLDQAVRAGQHTVDAVASAEEERAHHIRTEIDADLDLLEDQLSQTQKARDGIPPRIDALRERHAENEARVPDARRTLEELRDDHHPEAFRREGDNLEEYRELRAQVLEGLDSARKAHDEQRYLAAIGDVRNLDEAISLAGKLIDEVHDVLDRLETAEANTRAGYADAMNDHAAIDELRDGRLGVDDALAAEIAESEAAVEQLGKQLTVEKPHWFALARDATGSKTRAADLREEVVAEVEAHARAVQRLAELRSAGEDLDQRVQAERRDRPHVGRVVADARGAIDRVASLTSDPAIGGEELANAVANAAEWLERAQHTWKTERDLFRQAESELAAAQSRYDLIQGAAYGYGVHANCSHVEGDLDAARQAADQRDWDEVIRLAVSAKTAVNKENNEAEARAARKRRAAQRAARAASAASSYSSSSSSYSSSSSSFSSSSWSSSSSSYSGGSSYSSSSGGSSW